MRGSGGAHRQKWQFKLRCSHQHTTHTHTKLRLKRRFKLRWPDFIQDVTLRRSGHFEDMVLEPTALHPDASFLE